MLKSHIVKKYKITSARAILSAAIILFLFNYIDIRSVYNSLISINLLYIPLIIVLWTVNQFLLTLRWHILLRPLGFKLNFWGLILSTLSGKFLDFIVPGEYGVDVMRYWDLSRFSKQKAKPAISLFMDRLLGLSGCVAIGAIAVIPAAKYVGNEKMVYSLILFYGFITIMFFLIAYSNLISYLTRLFSSLSNLKINDFTEKVEEAIALYKQHMGTILKAFVISVVLRILMIINIYLFSKSLGWNLSPIYFFIFVPTILILTTLPISTQSLGVREGLYVYLFLQIDIPAEDSMALSLILFSWILVTSLMCGFVFLLKNRWYRIAK